MKGFFVTSGVFTPQATEFAEKVPQLELIAGDDLLAMVGQCPKCKGRMRLIALVKKTESVARFLAGTGEPNCVPERSPPRGLPYWRSTVLHRKSA